MMTHSSVSHFLLVADTPEKYLHTLHTEKKKSPFKQLKKIIINRHLKRFLKNCIAKK